MNKNRTDLDFLSQLTFSEKETAIELCKIFQKNTSDSETITILDHYLSTDLNGLSPQEISFLLNNSKSNWVDYLLYRYRFSNYGKLGKIPKFPLYLLIEPTSICNLRCQMCFQVDRSFSSNKDFMGKMDFNMFTRIVDEAAVKGTKAVTLASRGEPTLHPQFGEMLEYCAGKFYEIKMNTNATLLNTELSHKILRSNIGMVVFSVDAYDNEGYKRIRNSKKFSQVVENIINFHSIREKHYTENHVITRAHGVQVEDDFDKKAFFSYWKRITDEVTLSDSVMRWDTYNNNKTNKFSPCSTALDRMYIWHDGICNPCDADYKSYLKVGDVNANTIEDIWNGKAFDEFRNAHFSGNRSILNPCDRCEL
jgi:radical SAM protein with 4Fe4S-binding SPASM domain